MDRLQARVLPELKDIPASDLDVLRFGTQEEGDESRRTLMAKYAMRKLEVEILEIPAIDGPYRSAAHQRLVEVRRIRPRLPCSAPSATVTAEATRCVPSTA